MTDTEFDFRVELILKNDKNGLREIYQCYGKVIYNIMLDIVKSPQDAEDLTSDFFLKLWDTAGQYRKGTGHKRYLTVMAKNLALDFIRKRRHETPTLDEFVKRAAWMQEVKTWETPEEFPYPDSLKARMS